MTLLLPNPLCTSTNTSRQDLLAPLELHRPETIPAGTAVEMTKSSPTVAKIASPPTVTIATLFGDQSLPRNTIILRSARTNNVPDPSVHQPNRPRSPCSHAKEEWPPTGLKFGHVLLPLRPLTNDPVSPPWLTILSPTKMMKTPFWPRSCKITPLFRFIMKKKKRMMRMQNLTIIYV